MTLHLLGFWLRSLRYAWARSLTQLLAVAAGLALLGSILFFVAGNLGSMTRAAATRVPLDWQAAVPDAATATALAGKIHDVQGIVGAAPAATATLSGASHETANGLATAGSGSILAVPPDYLDHFHPFHLLTGHLNPSGVVLSQPLASTLQAQVGDRVVLQLTPLQTAPVVTVTGVAVIDVSELLFQPLGVSAAGAPATPPSQVVLAPIELFQQRLAGAQGVQWEVHAQVDRALIPGGPAEAQQRLTTFRHVVERTFPGELSIADNLGAALGVAAEQALYGQAIFIFLALPGVVIALWLAFYAAASGANDERRDIALLRTRGATRPDIVGAAVAQGLVVGVVAALIGLISALLAVSASGTTSWGLGTADLVRTGLVLVILGLCAGVGARLGIALRSYAAVVAAARAREPRATRPLWARLYLDVVALILSAIVFAIDRATGLSAVVTPDSNPTLALSLYSFLAPSLLWIGATLLLVRAGAAALRWAARRFPAARGSARLWPFLIQSAGRRALAVSRAVILVGLLLSFGISLGLFSATYDQQALADARLTLGADVVVTAPPNSQLSASTLAAVTSTPGVIHASGMRHTFAYVGPDLQDLLAIDPAGIAGATQLRDSYFSGTSATAALDALHQHADGVLVSAETIKDYGLGVGDLIRLRLLDATTSQYRTVDFHVIGVVKEFPTAPKDSFLVANLPYVLTVTHVAGPDVVLISAPRDPHGTRGLVQHAVAPVGARTADITEQAAATSSSLTAVSLAGISRLEEGFAVALALVAVVLFGGLTGIERRREFATMAAMGARLRTIASFVWTETTVVAGTAAALAIALGTALAFMLVTILTHVFDPPPDALAVPWRFVVLLALALVAGALVSAALTLVVLRQADLSSTLREG
jgi:putative ABC transport system permease protein